MNANTPQLRIMYYPIDCLKLDPKNARDHSPDQLNQIGESIKAFGFNVPVLIDESNKVLAGHGRIGAARKLGWKEVPAIQLEHLDPYQARAFAIADNRLTENSIWNEKILAENLKELSVLDLDFSLEVTGFTMGEIDLKIESLTDLVIEDEYETPSNDPLLPKVCKLGDVWQLGKHRLLCGDALNPASYGAVLQGELADVVFADPPFNVPIMGHVSGKGKVKHREFKMASGEMSEEEFIEFLDRCFRCLIVHSKSGSLHYLCMDWRHVFEITMAGRKNYSELKNICVWNKGNGGMGSLYRSQHELVFVYKNGSEKHRNNIQLGKYGRNRTNVWDYPGMNSFNLKSEEENLLSLHPTVKPVGMIADAILDSTARGEIVLDCFLGSGSTLMAAEKVGRACFGIEIDPQYIDTSIRRWQNLTGQKAIHIASGIAFDEMKGAHNVEL